MGGSWSQAENREERFKDTGEAADNSRQHQQWRLNLLDHIDAVQDEVSHRMDFIERELDGKHHDMAKCVREGMFEPVGWCSLLAAYCLKLKVSR